MEALALPVLAGSLVAFALLGLWISLRNPPRFWMDERRLPSREVKGPRTAKRVAGGVVNVRQRGQQR